MVRKPLVRVPKPRRRPQGQEVLAHTATTTTTGPRHGCPEKAKKDIKEGLSAEAPHTQLYSLFPHPVHLCICVCACTCHPSMFSAE